MENIEIFGSWGTLYVCPETGLVLIYDPEEPDNKSEGYWNITKFNLDEWKQYHNTDEVPTTYGLDILDFGYWSTDSPYQEPEWDWRHEMILSSLID